MAVYEWVFSGIGVLALTWVGALLKNYWDNRQNKRRNEETVKKQIAVLNALNERERINDLPDIRHDDVYMYDSAHGILQIGIANIGQPGTITEIRPPFGDWQYFGDRIPAYLRKNDTLILRFQIPNVGSKYMLPDQFKIYIRVNDRHNRVYSLALDVSSRGVTTTDLIQI